MAPPRLRRRPPPSRRSRSSTTTPATPTACSTRARSPGEPRDPAGGDLPRGGHALLGQPVLHPRRRLGRRRAASGRREVRRTSCSGPRTRRRCSSSASVPATPRSPSAHRSMPANGVDPDQPQTLLEVPPPAVMVDLLDAWADAAQGRPGAAGARRVGVDGRRRPIPDTGETKLDLAKRAGDRRARRVQARRRGRPADLHHRPRPGRAPGSVDLVPIEPIGDVRETPGQRDPATWSPSTARRCTTSPRRPTRMLDALRPGADQRRGPAHRRPQRRREPRRRRQQLDALLAAPHRRHRGRDQQAGAGLHHRLRRRRRPRRAAPDRRGLQRRGLRRHPTRARSPRSSPPWSATSSSGPWAAAAPGPARRAVDHEPSSE